MLALYESQVKAGDKVSLHTDASLSAARPVRYLGAIDAVRGIGVLGVLVVHSVVWSNLQGPNVAWLVFANRGVQLFYIASAFTLFLSYTERKKEIRPVQNFFLRRFFRIAPAFYVAIFLNFFMLLKWPALARPFPHAIDYLLAIFFLHGFKWGAINSVTGGAWSVADECMFYALIPLLHRFLTTIKRTVIAFACIGIVLAPVSEILAARFPDKEFLFHIMWFPVELPVFLLGIAAYHIWKHFTIPELALKPEAVTLSIICLVAVGGLFDPHHIRLLTESLGIAFFFLALLLKPWKLLVNRGTRYLGKISYSMYLFHFFVLRGLNLFFRVVNSRFHNVWHDHFWGRFDGFLISFALLLAVSIPICTLTWMFIEEPFIRLGRSVIAERENRARSADLPLIPDPAELISAFNTPDNQF
jgi:peptidoglycan/LPS O-acetylase OafA/YrhL